jgi:hypothetical protein
VRGLSLLECALEVILKRDSGASRVSRSPRPYWAETFVPVTNSLEDVSIESTVLLSEEIQPQFVESSPTEANTGTEITRQVRVKIKFFISSPYRWVNIAPFYVQKPCHAC